MACDNAHRVFLFLQGPHGPFFGKLGRMLEAAGASVWRVGFNKGDEVFWPDRESYIAFRDPVDRWADRVAALLKQKGVSDLVLYGDTRPHPCHGDRGRAGMRHHRACVRRGLSAPLLGDL